MSGKRRPLYSVGINDADYDIFPASGKRCQAYTKWADMLKRCYSDKFQKTKPNYIGCSVCDEWHIFSNFKSWLEKREYIGLELDKDIIVNGNKVYSPDTCLMVPKKINSIVTIKYKTGDIPIGIRKRGNSYEVRVSEINFGSYKSKKLAEIAYRKAKCLQVVSLIEEFKASHPVTCKALIGWTERQFDAVYLAGNFYLKGGVM